MFIALPREKDYSNPTKGLWVIFLLTKKTALAVVFSTEHASNRQKKRIKRKSMTTQETAFAQMVKEHKSTIYTVCFMFSKDTDEVNDLFQEVLVNLWKGFGSFKGESALSSWVWRVSFNTCISQERKKKRATTIPLSIELDLFNDSDEDSRQIRMLYNRIHRLKPFDRAIVLLWLENMSYEEIAAIVGITVKNVSVRLYRIKEELKNMSNQ